MATNTRKLSDFLAEGSGDTFGDLPVENPHIKPGTLYPAWSGLLEDNTGFTFTDSGNTGHTLTPNGDVYHDGRQKKIGSTALKFDGSDYISAPDHADWQLGTSMTIEAWVYVSAVNTDNVIIAQGGDGGSDVDGFCFRLQSGGNLQYNQYQSSALTSFSFAHGMSVNTWHHVAVSRDGTTIRMFVDGVLKTSATTAGVIAAVPNSGLTLTIGKAHTSHWYFNGHMDEIRVSSSARYTSAFTPSTSAFTSDSNTKLLIHSDAGGHSGAYGTAQSDGLKYYYTDIKGSKPIKDPRIGAHFGSQRFRTSSVQLLEQETATHGVNVYSIDGREWMRLAYAGNLSFNDDHGNYINSSGGAANATTDFMEVVGYFNDANISHLNDTNSDNYKVILDGGTAQLTDLAKTVNSPIKGRYVNVGELVNLTFNSTPSLGIHTLRFTVATNSYYFRPYGIELIVQDTTSTATKSQIQIPAQNVVSYGKKFSVSATTPHYNPFAFKTDGSTAWASGAHNGTSWPVGTGSSANIDTATSLGLANWLHSSNYYKPYNGGRVVVWVASDGTIKTSVNVMPPNARSIGNSASLTNATAKANASIANNTFYPTMEAGAIDHSQAEVAKTFHWREFGNGAANGGTGATYADASMLTTTDDAIAYVMDDGLTSLSGASNRETSGDLILNASGRSWYVTFIGTGISIKTTAYPSGGALFTVAQNLPYGTHVLKSERDADADPDITIDGVSFPDVNVDTYGSLSELTFHQPKKPPIPEDAVVLADYMLMADFVAQPADSSFAHGDISKGVRYLSGSRDIKYDNTSNITSGAQWAAIGQDHAFPQGFMVGGAGTAISAGSANLEIPYFGTDVCMTGYTGRLGSTWTESINSTTISNTVRNNSRESRVNTTGQTLQHNGFKATWTSAEMFIASFEIASPIHTSSHYQSFETPFLNELVGGDRNMEQTNLVVTADGKTWDEVTRDTSYIGTEVLNVMATSGNSAGGHLIPNGCRGTKTNRTGHNFWKTDYCTWAYDRMIFLKDGTYRISREIKIIDSYSQCRLFHNGTSQSNIVLQIGPNATGAWQFWHGSVVLKINRGEYIIVEGYNSGSAPGDGFYIERIEK